jgi:monoamine oxidase
MSDPRIVIIGAGAAGIAAGNHLLKAGVRPIVLEARNRVGGHAWTDSSLGVPVDMGCAWLHSATDNPWSVYAEQNGFEILKTPPDWGARVGRDEVTPQQRAAWDEAFGRNLQLIAEAAARGRDVAVAEVIPDDEARVRFDAVMGWWMGANSTRVSTLDFSRYLESGHNWSVRAGLGTVLAHAAGSLDVRLNAPVRALDLTGPHVRVTSDAGTLDADAVIVTVPTTVMAAGTISVRPALPVALLEAFAGLPLGANNKVFFEVTGALPFAGTTHFLGSATTVRTASYGVRPAGQDALLAYFGGDFARELEEKGELEAFARAELAALFGADFTRQLGRAVSTGWSCDPWALGSYSIALPGKAHLRAQLSEPLQNRVFFAGEAASIEHFGTIHGAWQSAVNAAQRALDALSAAT